MFNSNHRLPARQRAQLTATDVSVTRGIHVVLTDVNLAVSQGSRIALVGENGRGKSTLLHVLAGSLDADSGTVQRTGTLGLAEQEMAVVPGRTLGDAVAEAIAPSLGALAVLDATAIALAEGGDDAAESYAAALQHAEGLDAWNAERRVQIALEALDAETDFSRSLDTLSVGQRYRVRLACLLGAEDDFLLLDEPTNHLDRNGLDFLSAQLHARRGGVVVVTHDRALLADVAKTIVDLDPTPDARPRIYGGGYLGYRAGRLAEREKWEQEYVRQEDERARLHDSLSAAQNRLVSGWRPDKGTNKHQRATRAAGLVQAVHRRQEALDSTAVTVPEPPQQFRFPALEAHGVVALLTAERITLASRLPEAVNVSLSRGGRLVVAGPNGAGKSTLLSALAGELQLTTGQIRMPQTTRVGYLRQESELPLNRRASEVFADHIGALTASGMLEPSEAVGLSQLGLLRTREASKQIGELSMGQRRRLDLAIVIASRPHLLLLDEPTNHLSIALVDELTEALGTTQAAVVLSSHDRQLLRDTREWPRLNLGARLTRA